MIWLCYTPYEYKLTNKAVEYFRKETGRDLLGVLAEILATVNEAQQNNATWFRTAADMAKVITMKDASTLLYALIRECSSESMLCERIDDALLTVGPIPSDEDDEKARAYTIVLMVLAEEIFEEIRGRREEAKKRFSESVT